MNVNKGLISLDEWLIWLPSESDISSLESSRDEQTPYPLFSMRLIRSAIVSYWKTFVINLVGYDFCPNPCNGMKWLSTFDVE